jgi:hypothetical protein
MTRNAAQTSTFLVHRFAQKDSRFAMLCNSRFVVPGGTVAPRRTKVSTRLPQRGSHLATDWRRESYKGTVTLRVWARSDVPVFINVHHRSNRLM